MARCNSSTAPEKKFHINQRKHCEGLFKKDGSTICIIEPFLPHSHRPWDAELHTVCRHSFLKQIDVLREDEKTFVFVFVFV